MPRLTDFQKIIAMNTINGIGTGLVGIFIPIYLLEQHFSIFTTITWLLVHHATLLLGAFIAIYTSNHIGLVRCWYIRILLITILFTGLILLPTHHRLLFFLALISGLESAFFWIPYNIFTVRKTEYRTTGSSLALMKNIKSIVGIFIPAIAAFLIVSFGFNTLFIVALTCIICSIIPVLSMTEEKTYVNFSLGELSEIARKNKRFIIPEILDNVTGDAPVIWSLFIFITALTIIDLGILGVIAGLTGIVITYTTGKLIDNWSNKHIVRFGAGVTALTWFLSYIIAIYIPTPAFLYIITILRGFALGIFVSGYETLIINRIRGYKDAHMIVLREIPTVIGRAILFVLTLILISIGKIGVIFLIASIAPLYFLFTNLDILMKEHAYE